MQPNRPAAACPLRNERGVTLIELLTTLILMGMVAAILYSFMFMGLSMYKRVSVETQLRNQADTMYSRIITELRDAVYVKQGIDSSEIFFVKRAKSASGGSPVAATTTAYEKYIDVYSMRIDETGVMVEDENHVLKWKIVLTDKFKLEMPQEGDLPNSKSVLLAKNNQLVDLNLKYVRADSDTIRDIENSSIQIQSKIPLFRIE